MWYHPECYRCLKHSGCNYLWIENWSKNMNPNNERDVETHMHQQHSKLNVKRPQGSTHPLRASGYKAASEFVSDLYAAECVSLSPSPLPLSTFAWQVSEQPACVALCVCVSLSVISLLYHVMPLGCCRSTPAAVSPPLSRFFPPPHHSPYLTLFSLSNGPVGCAPSLSEVKYKPSKRRDRLVH